MNETMVIIIGAIAGIIGAITGAAGALMGYIAYKHSKELKAADRRIELETLRNRVHLLSVQLTDLLPLAKESKVRILAAIGKSKSGDMQLFDEEYDQDSARSQELANQIPNSDTNFKSLNRVQLEEKIIELDRTKGWIEELFKKYRDSLKDDKERGKELRMQNNSK